MKRVSFDAGRGSPTFGCQPTTESDDIKRGAATAALPSPFTFSMFSPSDLSAEAPLVRGPGGSR